MHPGIEWQPRPARNKSTPIIGMCRTPAAATAIGRTSKDAEIASLPTASTPRKYTTLSLKWAKNSPNAKAFTIGGLGQGRECFQWLASGSTGFWLCSCRFHARRLRVQFRLLVVAPVDSCDFSTFPLRSSFMASRASAYHADVSYRSSLVLRLLPCELLVEEIGPLLRRV
jgi:hypothetical protein